MGWFWGSGSQSSISPSAQSHSHSALLPDRPDAMASSEDGQSGTKSTSAGDSAMKDFLVALSTKSHQTTNTSATPPKASTSALRPTQESPPAEATPNLFTDEVLYSDTMSCRDAFDRAYYCQSFGGQFMSLYRYGGLRDCSENWGDWWWCMKNKRLGEEEKRLKTREYYKEKDRKRYHGEGLRSSEDVWQARTVKVERAFDLDPDLS